jgi:hypothetical protein
VNVQGRWRAWPASSPTGPVISATSSSSLIRYYRSDRLARSRRGEFETRFFPNSLAASLAVLPSMSLFPKLHSLAGH